LRRIYARAFSPRALKAYEDTVITACAQRISARIAQKARCDLIDEFCFPLPMDIISALVGIKAEDVYVTKDWIKTLVLWTADQHKPEFVAQGTEALRCCIEHLRPSVDDVLENLREGNLLSQLVEAHREQAAALDHDAILNLAAGLLVAGYETTSWTLAGTLAALLLHLCVSSSHYDELHANPKGVRHRPQSRAPQLRRRPPLLPWALPWRAWRPASGYRRCSTARRTCGSIRRSGRCFCSGPRVRRCTGPTRCASCSRQTPPPEAVWRRCQLSQQPPQYTA
jgi:cytochrome P450